MGKLFKYVRTDYKEDGRVIIYYEPTTDMYVDSYDRTTCTFCKRKVLGYSRHLFTKMWRISDFYGRYSPLYVSGDKSLVVEDDRDGMAKVMSPEEVMEDPSHYSFIKIDGTRISLDRATISREFSMNESYDLTVEGTFNFPTEDGIIVQDTMAAYFPITEEAMQDVSENVHIDSNMYTKCGGKLTLEPDHDIVYGIYILSIKKPEVLPAPLYKFMRENKYESIDRKKLKQFLDEYLREDTKRRAKILDEISQIGFMVSTRYSGALLSVENIKASMVPIEERKKLYEEYMKGGMTVSDYMKREAEMVESVKKDCVMTDIVESGSRGSWDQLKQLFVSRGFVTDVTGKIMKVPIYKNLTEGLDSRSMFLSCYGVRKGLADVADNTGVSGLMTRNLIYMAANTFQSSSRKACDSKRFLRMDINDEEEARAILGRYIFTDDTCNNMERITIDNYKQYIGCSVRLRSPLFCTDKHLCHFCCPHKELHELRKGKRWNVGLVSAASISEPLTQMVLRTFHHSGAAKKAMDNDMDDNAITDLSGVGRFFRKPKFTVDNVDKAVKKLFETFRGKKFIKFLYLEILISCLMWTKKKHKWRLAQDEEMKPVSMINVPGYESFLLGASHGLFARRALPSVGRSVGRSTFERLITD